MSDTSALQALSDRLARDYDATTWKAAFAGGLPAVPAVHEGQFTIVCTDRPDPEWTLEDMDALAGRFGGRCEPCAQGKALLVFDRPGNGIRAALLVQRLALRATTRTCLASGPAHEAHFACDGRLVRVLAGSLVEDALQALLSAAPGAIALEPRSYVRLEQALDEHAGDAVLASEWEHAEVRAATLTPAPCAQDALSTFAGLGRF